MQLLRVLRTHFDYTSHTLHTTHYTLHCTLQQGQECKPQPTPSTDQELANTVHNALDDSGSANANSNSVLSSHEECIASNNSLIKFSELQGTAEDLEMIRRERNRLHAKNTRIRKKASHTYSLYHYDYHYVHCIQKML
jgi:hypothetical protein